MTQMVSCSQCQSVVPQSETEFSTKGALLCRLCAMVGRAHTQANRVYENALQAADTHRVGNVVYVNSDQYNDVVAAKRAADGLHESARALAAHGRVATPTKSECSRCMASVPTETTTYSFEGKLMCRACADKGQVAVGELPTPTSTMGAATTVLLLGLIGIYSGHTFWSSMSLVAGAIWFIKVSRDQFLRAAIGSWYVRGRNIVCIGVLCGLIALLK